MIGRLVRGWLVVAAVVVGFASAQGDLVGELLADDVRGYVVIACFVSASEGCDEARSAYAEIGVQGPRAPFSIAVADAGPFLMVAWLDADGDGEPDEEELVVLQDALGQPRLVLAPAAGLSIVVTGGSRSPVGSPVTGAPPASALPWELVGVWQQTRAAAGDYQDLTTGRAFTMTSGFSSLLKLRGDGSFVYQFYSSGVAPDCAFVSSLDTAVGWASFEGGRLALRPTERTVDVARCQDSGKRALPLDPIVFDAVVTEDFDFHGHRTWSLDLAGGPNPLAMTLLHREPATSPPQPAQPPDFVLGTAAPYAEVVGVWSPERGSDLGFFEPTTNAFYLPEYDGARDSWIRFSESGYDLARAWPDYGSAEGVCEKDYVYYERGRADFVTLATAWETYSGHVRFAASDARVVVRVRDCGVDDAVTVYALTPQVSFYAWRYATTSTYGGVEFPETFHLSCPWSRSEWQFMVCDGWSPEVSYVRR